MDDPKQLLGAFATDTLTEQERQALFEAALHNQQLFEALADEQHLKDLLADPVHRRQLLTALAEARREEERSWMVGIADWFHQPRNLALTGSLATVGLALLLYTTVYEDVTSRDRSHSANETSSSSPDQNDKASPLSPTNETPTQQRRDAGESQMSPSKSPTKEPGSREGEKTAPPDRASSATGARELFLQGRVSSAKARSFAAESERLQPASEPPVADAPIKERKERSALRDPAPSAALRRQSRAPIGIRYSFVIRASDGQKREVDRIPILHDDESLYLTVESNVDGYLAMWRHMPHGHPELLFPDRGSSLERGTTPARVRAGDRRAVPLVDMARNTRSLPPIVVSFAPTLSAVRHTIEASLGSTRQEFKPGTPPGPEVTPSDETSLLIEAVQPVPARQPEETAVYVANPLSSSIKILVPVPLEAP